MQYKQLKMILSHAYENVPFYRKKFMAVGIRPDDIKSVADLSKLPVTTKQEIQSLPLQDLTANNINISKCIKRMTSGSTGIPLTVVVDPARVDFELALWMRTFFENGLRTRDKMAVITDPRNFPRRKSVFQKIGLMRSKYLSVFDDSKNLRTDLEEYAPEVVKGYPSSLSLLVKEGSLKSRFRPRLVFTCAELLDKANRERISSLSQNPVLDNYSCSEFNLLGWECREHSGYHINVDSTLLEFVRDQEIAAPGERGEIICTNLSNFSMPLIRYAIGDVGVSKKDKCPCGRTLPLMDLVEGRTGDFLVTTDNRLVPPIIFFPYPFESDDCFEGVSQFRVIQKRIDEMTIQLVAVEHGPSIEQLENARKEIQRIFGRDMRVTFEFVENIQSGPTGKLKKIVSLVATNKWAG